LRQLRVRWASLAVVVRCGHACHAVAPAGLRCIMPEGKSASAKSNGKAKGKVQKAKGKWKE
jgi:hypothetical protein